MHFTGDFGNVSRTRDRDPTNSAAGLMIQLVEFIKLVEVRSNTINILNNFITKYL